MKKLAAITPSRVAADKHHVIATVDAPPERHQKGVCPHCGGAGYMRLNVPFGHPEFGKAQQCECRSREIQARSISQTYTWLDENARLAQKLESRTFESFRAKANGVSVSLACRQATEYALSVKHNPTGQRNCLFVGPYGVGKTHLACAILNEARANGVGCLFVSGNRLFQALYERDFDEQILRRVVDVPLLLFDDLDKMQQKDDGSYQKSTLFWIFEQRDLAERPTIITANSMEDWKPWLHGAVLSRLIGNAVSISMQGQDYRLLRAAQSA